MGRGLCRRSGAGAAGLAAALLVLQPVSALTPVWKAHTAPLPGGAASSPQYAFLNAVTCLTATECTIVGRYTAGDGSGQGWLLSGSGGAWSAQEAPSPASLSGQNFPTAVACSAPGDCAAVDYRNAPSVILSEHGGTWTASDVAAPNAGTSLYLDQVGCSATACSAVATYTDSTGNAQLAVVTGSGSSWAATPVALPKALPSGYQLQLDGMSCDNAGTCEAVGGYVFNPGPGPEDYTGSPIVMSGAGSTWTAFIPKLPSNAEKYVYAQSYPGDVLHSVSCPAHGGPCVAAGVYVDTSVTLQTLILSGHTTVEGPTPSGSKGAEAWFVSCPSRTSCSIAGTYDTSSVTGEGMVLTGSGSAWAVAVAPLPLPAGGSPTAPNVDLTGFSCSSSQCALTGRYVDGSGSGQALLGEGSGASWTTITPPLPAHASQPSLAGVACAGARCIAVGSYVNSVSGNDAGLIEALS